MRISTINRLVHLPIPVLSGAPARGPAPWTSSAPLAGLAEFRGGGSPGRLRALDFR